MLVAFPQLNVPHISLSTPLHMTSESQYCAVKEGCILPPDFLGVSLTAFKVSIRYHVIIIQNNENM